MLRLGISLPPALLYRPGDPKSFLPLLDGFHSLRPSLLKRSFRECFRIFESVRNDILGLSKAAVDR